MAASTFVPARTARSASAGRGAAAVAAARTAPRGAGLAPVVALPIPSAPVPDGPEHGPVTATRAPALQLVADRRSARVALRPARRIGSAVLAVALLLATVGVGVAATAQQAPLESAGHVVLQPGETLWDVAVRSAAPGVDPRRQLDDLRRLNAFGPGPLDAWTVVLIPAR